MGKGKGEVRCGEEKGRGWRGGKGRDPQELVDTLYSKSWKYLFGETPTPQRLRRLDHRAFGALSRSDKFCLKMLCIQARRNEFESGWAQSAGAKRRRKIFGCAPPLFCGAPQLGGHFKQWRGGAMACGARANVCVAAFSAPSNRGINYVDI